MNLTTLCPAYKCNHTVSIFLWLAYFPQHNVLMVLISRKMCQNHLFFLKKLNNIPLYEYNRFVQPLITLGLFDLLTIVNNSVIHMGSLWDADFNSLGYIPRSGITGSNKNSFFFLFLFPSFIFEGQPYCWYSHQQCTRVSISPHLCQHLFSACLCFCFIMAILMSIKGCLTVVLICIFLRISDAEHLLRCILALCIFSLRKVYSNSSPISDSGCLSMSQHFSSLSIVRGINS